VIESLSGIECGVGLEIVYHFTRSVHLHKAIRHARGINAIGLKRGIDAVIIIGHRVEASAHFFAEFFLFAIVLIFFQQFFILVFQF